MRWGRRQGRPTLPGTERKSRRLAEGHLKRVNAHAGSPGRIKKIKTVQNGPRFYLVTPLIEIVAVVVSKMRYQWRPSG